ARTGARPGASPEAAARTAPQRGPGCRRTRALPPRSLRASGAGRARTEGRSRARARRGAGNAEATRGARRRAVRACSCCGACRTWLRRLRDCVQTRTGRNRAGFDRTRAGRTRAGVRPRRPAGGPPGRHREDGALARRTWLRPGVGRVRARGHCGGRGPGARIGEPTTICLHLTVSQSVSTLELALDRTSSLEAVPALI